MSESKSKRYAFFVDETMKTPQGYIPALVTEDEAGFSPMIGNGEFSSPWYWGTDIETARRICAEANAERGISEVEARKIVESSIAAQIREDAEKQAAEDRYHAIKRGRRFQP